MYLMSPSERSTTCVGVLGDECVHECAREGGTGAAGVGACQAGAPAPLPRPPAPRAPPPTSRLPPPRQKRAPPATHLVHVRQAVHAPSLHLHEHVMPHLQGVSVGLSVGAPPLRARAWSRGGGRAEVGGRGHRRDGRRTHPCNRTPESTCRTPGRRTRSQGSASPSSTFQNQNPGSVGSEGGGGGQGAQLRSPDGRGGARRLVPPPLRPRTCREMVSRYGHSAPRRWALLIL